jgi:hypothetical protein
MERTKRNETVRMDINSDVANSEISKIGIGIMATVAGGIGIWAVTCFASAVYQSGGLISLGRGFITAVTGS